LTQEPKSKVSVKSRARPGRGQGSSQHESWEQFPVSVDRSHLVGHGKKRRETHREASAAPRPTEGPGHRTKNQGLPPCEQVGATHINARSRTPEEGGNFLEGQHKKPKQKTHNPLRRLSVPKGVIPIWKKSQKTTRLAERRCWGEGIQGRLILRSREGQGKARECGPARGTGESGGRRDCKQEPDFGLKKKVRLR